MGEGNGGGTAGWCHLRRLSRRWQIKAGATDGTDRFGYQRDDREQPEGRQDAHDKREQ